MDKLTAISYTLMGIMGVSTVSLAAYMYYTFTMPKATTETSNEGGATSPAPATAVQTKT